MGPSIGRIQSTGVVFDDDDDDVEVARVCFGCALLCSVLFFERYVLAEAVRNTRQDILKMLVCEPLICGVRCDKH